MKIPNISAALATFNEEENIADLIESAKKVADEIVVVDGTSQDRTAQIAANLGVKVIKTSNTPMFHINKNLAIKNCRGDWILMLDADERVTEELAKEIKRVVSKNPTENGFYLNRKNWFLGDFLTKGGAYPDSVIRLFRKGKGILPEKSVHEQIDINGEIGHLKNDLLHFADPDFARYLKRAQRYIGETSENISKADPGRGINQIIFYMLIKPSLTFLNLYFRHRGYRDGFRGFVWSVFSGAHHFYAYTKYWHQSEKDKVN
ncbi:MAG: Lipopolysaccharide biosynthesis glycosyltransferase [Parcubacteria group bacterium GW2011_GWA1_36_12]|nr:MAG: Lipopolysaccharide biosynthesis glycosyltransferase [Parcubacteria group bacterium GW2011_GWA1_36_12]